MSATPTLAVTRTRVHNGLSMAMLKRLDAMVLNRNDVPAETAMARIVSQDFDAYLDLIETGGGGAAAMLFVHARDGGLYSLAGRTIDATEDEPEDFANHCQLGQDSADSGDAEQTEIDPVETAAAMSVWHCEDVCEWRTDFPPPDEFDGEKIGLFGDGDYERSLTDEEERIQAIVQHAALRPLRDAAQEAHERWFGGEAGAAVRAKLSEEKEAMEEARARRQAERERAAVETKAAEEAAPIGDVTVSPLPAEPLPVEPAPVDAPAPEYDFAAAYQPDGPTHCVIQSKPQTNWALRGVMPPGVAAQLGIQLPHDDPRRQERW